MEKQEEYLVQAISDYLFEMCFAIISKNMSVKSSKKKYHIYTRFVPGYTQPQIISVTVCIAVLARFVYCFVFAFLVMFFIALVRGIAVPERNLHCPFRVYCFPLSVLVPTSRSCIISHCAAWCTYVFCM